MAEDQNISIKLWYEDDLIVVDPFVPFMGTINHYQDTTAQTLPAMAPNDVTGTRCQMKSAIFCIHFSFRERRWGSHHPLMLMCRIKTCAKISGEVHFVRCIIFHPFVGMDVDNGIKKIMSAGLLLSGAGLMLNSQILLHYKHHK